MTELVRQDSYATATLTEKREYVTAIAQAGELLPKSLWTTPKNVDGTMVPAAPSPAKVLMLAETGSMLGLHPMAALTGIHIIEGKPSLSANLLGALVRRAGHRLRVTTTGDWKDGTFIARAALARSDDPDFEFVVEWTPKRASQAGLNGKGNWSKYPEAMAKARAITEVIREGAPDVTMSAAYTPEELGAQVEGEEGEPVELKQAPKQQAPIKESKPAAKPRAKSKPKAPSDEMQAEIDERQKGYDDASQGGATPEAATAMADAEAKARVKANQEARVIAEAKADESVEADPETGEVEITPEERSAYARVEADIKNPDNIEDAQLVEDAEGTDWQMLLVEAENVDDMKQIWADARTEGVLDLEVEWMGSQQKLRDIITELGTKFAADAAEQE